MSLRANKYNLNDYGHKEKLSDGSIKATNKNTKETIVYNRYTDQVDFTNDTKYFYDQPSIFNLEGLVKILEVQTHSDYTIVITENGPQNLKEANTKILNDELIRSKIIFGVAAIMKRLHKNHVLQGHLFDHVYLDENNEPLIKLDSDSYIIKNTTGINRDKILMGPTVKFPQRIFSPEYEFDLSSPLDIGFPSDIFEFGMFVYSLFSGHLNETDFMKYDCRAHSKYEYHLFIIENRPRRISNIPEKYWELINKCWNDNPDDRPTFADIVEELKSFDDIPEELFEYMERIDKKPKELKDSNEVKKLKEKIERLEKALSIKSQNPNNDSNDTNFFIDDDEEDKYHVVVGEIGGGATSITYKVVDKRTNIPMCKKVIKYKNGQVTIKDAQNAMKEFEILYEIKHPCICKSFFINTAENIDIIIRGKKQKVTTISLFLEHLEYGLKDVLEMNINNTLKTKIIVDIVHAMNYIHKKGMMHRDLKIDNIMLNSIFETKIVDFGLARITECVLNDFSYVNDSLTKGIGTLAYMSPEMAREENYDYKTDVYSFGVVLYFVFTGSLPKQSLMDKINGKKVKLPSPSSSISKFCIEIIEKCLMFDSSLRPSFDQILKELRSKSFQLASDIDPSIVSRRDEELSLIESQIS